MTEFHYFVPNALSKIDKDLVTPSHQNYKWLQLHRLLWFPSHLQSRVPELQTPWPLAPALVPMPTTVKGGASFGDAMDAVAVRFLDRLAASDRTAYVAWSGGVDSTAILAALFRNMRTELIERIVVLHSVESVQENSYFYHKFIKPTYRTQDINTFVVTADNYSKMFLLDGEVGNQCSNFGRVTRIYEYSGFDILRQPWQRVNNLGSILYPTAPSQEPVQLLMDVARESIKYSPVEIKTVFDFSWWLVFNFKFMDSLLRKVVELYAPNLNATQLKDFWYNSLFRFFAEPEVQDWSLTTTDQRMASLATGQKMLIKQYIYSYDKNHLYLSNKGEEPSFYAAYIAGIKGRLTVGIDTDWNTHSIGDVETRRMCRDILTRTV